MASTEETHAGVARVTPQGELRPLHRAADDDTRTNRSGQATAVRPGSGPVGSITRGEAEGPAAPHAWGWAGRFAQWRPRKARSCRQRAPRRAHSRFPGAVCRQRWTVRLGEVEPVFGQTGRVVLDITARTAHDGALKWTRAPSTPRAARSIFATFPSTCALPSGGRWSLRRVLQRPGRQRKWSSAKSSCGPSRTSSSAPSSPPCCNARCAPPRLATRRAPSCATCPGGCGATAWRPSTFAPPGARRCRSRRRTTARNTPVGRSGGRDSTP